MSPRRLARIASHLLLAATMVMAGIAAPMQALVEVFATAAETQQAVAEATPAMSGMPCDDMQMMAADMGTSAATPDAASGDACARLHCSLEACLGTACLPEFPRIAVQATLADAPAAWMPVPRLARLLDTPLRPPIA